MKEPVLADDMLDGAEAIGKFIGVSRRRAFYLCESGTVPAFKLGNRWCARKSELRDALRSGKAGAAA